MVEESIGEKNETAKPGNQHRDEGDQRVCTPCSSDLSGIKNGTLTGLFQWACKLHSHVLENKKKGRYSC
jgi:hypothetical protein